MGLEYKNTKVVEKDITKNGTGIDAQAREDITNLDAQLAQIPNQPYITDKATKTELDAVASGSPKGVYATLTDLQNAFPTGDTNIHLVSADGKWYYWDGSAWVAGGVYQGTDWQEGINARQSTVKNKTFDNLGGRLEESENDTLSLEDELAYRPAVEKGDYERRVSGYISELSADTAFLDASTPWSSVTTKVKFALNTAGTVKIRFHSKNDTTYPILYTKTVTGVAGDNESTIDDFEVPKGAYLSIYYVDVVPKGTDSNTKQYNYYFGAGEWDGTGTLTAKTYGVAMSYELAIFGENNYLGQHETKINTLMDNQANVQQIYNNYKKIGTIYIEKFIGTVMPTAPFGVWDTSGTITINDGVVITPAVDWTAYIQWVQRTHFDSDGMKWRVKLNDITSLLRIERRSAHTPGGFTSTAGLENGVMKIYQWKSGYNVLPDTVLVERATTLTLVAGREYNMSLEVFGEVLTFTISDTVTGETDTLSYVSTNKGDANAGRAWDFPRFYLASGDVKIMQLDYFSRLPRSPKVVILGDSINEADTIRNLEGGGYTKRFGGLLYDELDGDVVIMGTAGETSNGIIEKIPVMEKAFKEPQYAILTHMTNDTDFATWKANTEQLIASFEAKGTVPVIGMMPEREGRNAFYLSVLDYVEKSPYKVIWFNRALTVGGDGVTNDSQYYTGDMLHPNVEGHRRMFEQIKADLEEIFPIDY